LNIDYLVNFISYITKEFGKVEKRLRLVKDALKKVRIFELG